VVNKAVEIVGGGAYFRRSRLERLWRDVQAAQFHPLPESKQLVFTGRVAMGLSPV
jgi:alkylation response protein AidB-like acyl-CoA dehydrogenase